MHTVTEQNSVTAATDALTEQPTFLRRFLAWLDNKLAPIGYEDDSGFHYGPEPTKPR